jgi:hypothetical protein
MLINYDPDGIPNITNEMLEYAKRFNLHPVVICCDESNSQVGDSNGVSFATLVSFIPRQGERIILENGRTCEVRRVYYKVVSIKDTQGNAESIILVPNIYAYNVDNKSQ